MLVDTKHWTGKFFAITLTTVVVLSIFCGILQGSVFGFAGMLPPAYTRAVMGGQVISAFVYIDIPIYLPGMYLKGVIPPPRMKNF